MGIYARPGQGLAERIHTDPLKLQLLDVHRDILQQVWHLHRQADESEHIKSTYLSVAALI